MEKDFKTKDGVTRVTLTKDDIAYFASIGDIDAKKELMKDRLNKVSMLQEEVDLIKEYLGLI